MHLYFLPPLALLVSWNPEPETSCIVLLIDVSAYKRQPLNPQDQLVNPEYSCVFCSFQKTQPVDESVNPTWGEMLEFAVQPVLMQGMLLTLTVEDVSVLSPSLLPSLPPSLPPFRLPNLLFSSCLLLSRPSLLSRLSHAQHTTSTHIQCLSLRICSLRPPSLPPSFPPSQSLSLSLPVSCGTASSGCAKGRAHRPAFHPSPPGLSPVACGPLFCVWCVLAVVWHSSALGLRL